MASFMTSFMPIALSWAYAGSLFLSIVLLNLLWQQLPRPKSEPPLVFHWLPFIGNAVSYGMDPFTFYSQCREKHGDVFTFVLFGRQMTVYLGIQGNDFILNGKLQDLNAEDIYSPLTTPVFGRDIIYDCPNSKLMEQKKFVKFGLTQKALESYVPLIEKEVVDYIHSAPAFQGTHGTVDIPTAMAEITIFTASRCLQGAEVRKKLTGEFAELYHDLDLGFRPINFLMPWAPLPRNRRRDIAHVRMRDVYLDLIKERRNFGDLADQESDMIRNLMNCVYKNGTPLPDKEIAHMMITILMAGQHSSSSSSAWTMLRLASRPDIADELYQEVMQLAPNPLRHEPLSGQLQYADLEKLPFLANIVKETLRVHSSIHSIMRKVKQPIRIPNSDYIVTPEKVLVSSPIMTHLSEEHFRNAMSWDPYRWDDVVEADDDIVDYGYGETSKGTKSPYLPFGAGRHRCIGEKFAYLNLATIISTLVRNFKFSTLNGETGVVPPTDYTSLFSRPMQPAVLQWERRKVT